MKYEYVTDSGVRFWYEPNTNRIYNEDDQPLFLEFNKEWHYPTPNSSEEKSKKPMSLKVTLGHACNYDCSYCLQKDIGDPSERPKNAYLDTFFNNVEQHLDLSDLVEIQLWGGEPFLYWNDIVPIIEKYDREGITFLIISNGSALRQKHYDFLSNITGNVNLIISHDGPGQTLLRGKDPLDSPSVVEVLKQFDSCDNVSYNFLSVVGKRNYDLFSIEKYFYDRMIEHGLDCRAVSYSIGKSYETDEQRKNSNSADEVITGEDKVKFKKILNDYLQFHAQKFKEYGYDDNGNPNVFNVDPEELDYMLTGIYEYDDLSATGFARSIIRGVNLPNVATCGADMSNVLSIDLMGNVRTCPHVDSSFVGGNIKSMDTARAVKMNTQKDDCIGIKCPVYKMCKGGCPLKIAKHDFLINCGIESVWYEGIQEAAFGFIFDEQVKRITPVYRNSYKYTEPKIIGVINV